MTTVIDQPMSDTSNDQRLAVETGAGNKSASAPSSAAATAATNDHCYEEQSASMRGETTTARASAAIATSSHSPVIEHDNTSCSVPEPETSRCTTDNDDQHEWTSFNLKTQALCHEYAATPSCSIQIRIEGQALNALLDTGAGRTLINSRVYERYKDQFPIKGPANAMLTGASGTSLTLHGTAFITFGLCGLLYTYPFIVADIGGIDALLGMDFLRSVRAEIDLGEMVVKLC